MHVDIAHSSSQLHCFTLNECTMIYLTNLLLKIFSICLLLFAITYNAEINTLVNILIYLQGSIWLFSLPHVLHMRDTYHINIYLVCQSVHHTRRHPNSPQAGV